MLEPPVSHQEFMIVIEDTNRRMRQALIEHYRVNGVMTNTVTYRETSPARKVIPQVVAHPSARAAEAAKQLVPPGVHFTDKPRVSGAIRERYLDHLREACQHEYIDVAEMTARMDAMMIANTEDELKFLIHDLPALPEAKEEAEKEQPSYKEVTEFTMYAAAASVISIASPGQLFHWITMVIALTMCGIAFVKWSAVRKSARKR